MRLIDSPLLQQQSGIKQELFVIQARASRALTLAEAEDSMCSVYDKRACSLCTADGASESSNLLIIYRSFCFSLSAYEGLLQSTSAWLLHSISSIRGVKSRACQSISVLIISVGPEEFSFTLQTCTGHRMPIGHAKRMYDE